MGGRGRARDNIFTERQWRTVKYKEAYLHEYVSPKDAYRGLSQYIYFYDYERPYHDLDCQTPAQVYGVKDQTIVYSTLRKEPTLQ